MTDTNILNGSNNSNIALYYYNALIKKYEAEIEEAKANLALYFSNNLSAIGEHSDLLSEHDKWVDKLTTSKDKLTTLLSFTNNVNKTIII